MDFKELITSLATVISELREHSLHAVNTSLEIKALRLPNSDERELKRYHQLYIVYPSAFEFIEANKRFLSTLTPELLEKASKSIVSTIRGLPKPEFIIKDNHYNKVFVAKYLVALPNDKELEQFIKKELKENWQQKGKTD